MHIARDLQNAVTRTQICAIARDLQNAVTRTQICANARDWPTTVARTYFCRNVTATKNVLLARTQNTNKNYLFGKHP